MKKLLVVVAIAVGIVSLNACNESEISACDNIAKAARFKRSLTVFSYFRTHNWPHSSRDRMEVSGTSDLGSSPSGATDNKINPL